MEQKTYWEFLLANPDIEKSKTYIEIPSILWDTMKKNSVVKNVHIVGKLIYDDLNEKGLIQYMNSI